MRSLLIGKKVVQKKPIEYYPLTDEFGSQCESYGIGISSADGEETAVHGITLSQGKILWLVSALMEHTVTPATLRDVVDD